jgi:hypothetical protein
MGDEGIREFREILEMRSEQFNLVMIVEEPKLNSIA